MTSSDLTVADCINIAKAAGICILTPSIVWDVNKNRKSVVAPKGYAEWDFETSVKQADPTLNGFAILCGRRVGSSQRIVVFDFDTAKCNAASKEFPAELTALCETHCGYIESTPNGMHYYFKLADHHEDISSSQNAKFNGKKVQFLDILSNGYMSIAAPSKYKKPTGVMEYKIIKGGLNEITTLPDDFYNALSLTAPRPSPDPEPPTAAPTMAEIVEEAIQILPPVVAEEYQSWMRVGFWLKGIGASFELWNTFSAKAPNYDQKGVLNFWRTANPNGSIGFGTILYLIKEHCAAEVYKDFQTKLWDIVASQQFELRKEQFEQNHFYCKETQDICEIRDDGSLMHYKVVGANFTFAEYNYFIKNEMIEFIPQWLRSPEKRCINRIVNTPRDPPAGCYNLFTGFAGKKAKGENKAGLERFLYLINLLANKDPVARDHIVAWFARLVQKPAEIPRWALIFIGEEGVGKDTVADFFAKKVIGHYSIITDAENQLYDAHSTAMVGTFVQKLEEASALHNRKYADKLKALITQTVQTVNEKNVKKFHMDAFPNFIMTTNNQSPVKLSETDRRFFMTWVSSERMGDKNFWDETYMLLDDERTVASVWKYLSEYSIGQFPSIAPETALKKGLQKEDGNSSIEFIKKWTNSTDNSIGENGVFSTSLYLSYRSWCTDEGIEPHSIVAFGKSLVIANQRGLLRRVMDGHTKKWKHWKLVGEIEDESAEGSPAPESPPPPQNEIVENSISEAETKRRDTLMSQRRKQLATKGAPRKG